MAPYERWQYHHPSTLTLPLVVKLFAIFIIAISKHVKEPSQGYFQPFVLNINEEKVSPRNEFQKNYAANKTKQVAWFVSNCGARWLILKVQEENCKSLMLSLFSLKALL